MIKTEEQFNQAIEEWEKHCEQLEVTTSYSSEMMIDCDAYRKIIAMGYEALPLIKKEYEKDKDFNYTTTYHGLVRAIKDIMGDEFKLPGETLEINNKYAKEWLNKYLGNLD